jgi:DNA primase
MRRTHDELYAGMVLVTVRRRAVERRILDVQSTFTRLSTVGDPAALAAAQNELWVLQQYDQALRERGAEAL